MMISVATIVSASACSNVLSKEWILVNRGEALINTLALLGR